MNINKVKNIHHKFLFQHTCVKCNYLWSHLQVRLDGANGVVTLFFYFSHIWSSGSPMPLGTLLSPSIGFNPMTNFSSTRSMEFHWFGHWNFKTLCIPSTLSMNWAEQDFWPLEHLSNRFQGEKTEKNFQKIIFH